MQEMFLKLKKCAAGTEGSPDYHNSSFTDGICASQKLISSCIHQLIFFLAAAGRFAFLRNPSQ